MFKNTHYVRNDIMLKNITIQKTFTQNNKEFLQIISTYLPYYLK